MDASPFVSGLGSAPTSVAETHTAIVLFVGDRAYKVKKPVDLGFCDFTARETRERVCHDEVRLNRRFTPDVYLGVADITGPDGLVADHAVVMRRLPPDRKLAACVARGDDVDDALRRIARHVAVAHEATPTDPAWHHVADVDALRSRWQDGFDVFRSHAELLEGVDLDGIEASVHRYLDGRRPLFGARIAAGRVRDGHGDLMAADVYLLDDGPRILDCLEFAEELRWGDVLADVAFLAMDLHRLGHPELGERFLAQYRDLAGDAWPASLEHHHVAYRAQVRAKVALLRADQGDEGSLDEARHLLELVTSHLAAGDVSLTLVGGLPGTGKSTLARALADDGPAVLLRTDELRRDRPATGADRYHPEEVAAVYDDMLERAEHLLAGGESVVLDATWADDGARARARGVATATSSTLHELRCVLDPDLAAERMRARAAEGQDPSEATPEVAAAMARAFADWPEAVEIDTRSSVHASVNTARRRTGRPVRTAGA